MYNCLWSPYFFNSFNINLFCYRLWKTGTSSSQSDSWSLFFLLRITVVNLITLALWWLWTKRWCVHSKYALLIPSKVVARIHGFAVLFCLSFSDLLHKLELILFTFQILKPADKKKFPYGNSSTGRPLTPTRNTPAPNAKKGKKWRKLVFSYLCSGCGVFLTAQ